MASVKFTLKYWEYDLDHPTHQPAGRAMSKALRAAGITENGDGPTVRITTGRGDEIRDGYSIEVPEHLADRLISELWKDPRVISVDKDGTNLPRPDKTQSPELEAFKKKVLEVALKAKEAEDWSDDGFAKAMKELGIKVSQGRTRVVLEFDTPPGVDPGDKRSVQKYIDDFFRWQDVYDSIVSATAVEG